MFEASSETYDGRVLRFLTYPNGGILFRTMDICLIAGISGRSSGILGPYLNLDSAVLVAIGPAVRLRRLRLTGKLLLEV